MVLGGGVFTRSLRERGNKFYFSAKIPQFTNEFFKLIHVKIYDMTFNIEYLKILNIVKNDIDAVNNELIKDIELAEPLKSQLINFLTSPSKRIRPLLAFLFLRANGLNADIEQYSLQTAIELVHNASLIHDDIIDESQMRRSQETINSKFGNKLAVITGDYILSTALRRISALNSPKLLAMFSETLSNMCQGEVNQHFSKNRITSLEEYILKSKQKTAKLFKTAVAGSLLIKENENIKQAEEFGENFGIAFQIRDDLINAKTSNTDIKDGIYNAPVIFSGNANDIGSGIEKTYLLLNNYIDKAFDAIKGIDDNIYKQAIIELLGIFRND